MSLPECRWGGNGQTVYGLCLPPWNRQEDSALRPVTGGGALRLHEAAHWHHVRIEEVPVEEFCPLDLKRGDRQQLSQFQGASDVLAEDIACHTAATMAGTMRDLC